MERNTSSRVIISRTGLPDFSNGCVEPFADSAVALEVGFDVPFCFLAIDAKRLRETEWGLTVDDAEVHRLGVAAHLAGHHERRNPENLGGCARVNVLAVAERADEHRIAGEVRQQA